MSSSPSVVPAETPESPPADAAESNAANTSNSSNGSSATASSPPVSSESVSLLLLSWMVYTIFAFLETTVITAWFKRRI